MMFRYYTMAIGIAKGVWLSRTGEKNNNFFGLETAGVRDQSAASRRRVRGGDRISIFGPHKSFW